jgi:CelD/BcsL family acetyltransferase involved in cellulose biosynthesis
VRSRIEAGALWRNLEARLQSTGLTNSWTWTDCWLEAYGADIPHWFVVAAAGSEPVGIALITRGRGQARGPLPVRTVHIGTAGERPGETVRVEYNRLLVDPTARAWFLEELIAAPGVRAGSADVLELNGFAPEEIPPSVRAQIRIVETPCPAAVLEQTADATLATFDGDTRRKIRTNLHRLESDFGPLATEWVTDLERACEVMAELIERHQDRWTSAGMIGAFASARFRTFHYALLEHLLPVRRAVLVRVTAGGTLVGIFHGFVDGTVLLHYQWGLAMFEDKRISPGFVTGYLTMAEARNRGLTELNWLAGNSRYKRDLSNTTRSLLWGEKRLSPWLAAVNGMIKIKRARRGQS